MEIKEITSKSILTKGTGFVQEFSHTLNPYAGCAYGCRYCYVRALPVSLFREQEWGTWVDIKANAAELLRKELPKAKQKGPVVIFMSSSTDPYQPIEHKARITRSLLEVMLESEQWMPDFLHVQTRSPLVKRDIDLFRAFGERIRISMTIETDLDKVRKLFSPAAPPIPARLKALQEITAAGIPTQISMSPLLPASRNFPKVFREVTSRVLVDTFQMGDGSRGKRTEKMGIRDIFEAHNLLAWYEPNAYKKVLEMLKEEFDDVDLVVSQRGFSPTESS